MGFAETIAKIKEISKKLRDKNVSDRETIYYTSELHRLIENLEVPQLIGQEDDNIFRNILHN
tara:strand:+ start:2915 stop:3100 length:186 start_codon:yes stop_codon:yes gene_type:complete